MVTHKPAGYFIAPEGEERVGDVSNVVFSNGWIERKNGEVLIYYASSDTRLHVATSSVSRLLDYVLHTPADPLRSHACVEQRYALIEKNRAALDKLKLPGGKKDSGKDRQSGEGETGGSGDRAQDRSVTSDPDSARMDPAGRALRRYPARPAAQLLGFLALVVAHHIRPELDDLGADDSLRGHRQSVVDGARQQCVREAG